MLMLYLIIRSEIWISLSLNSIQLYLYILGIWNITSIIAFNQLRIEFFIFVVTCNYSIYFSIRVSSVQFEKTNKEIFASDVTRPWEYREKQLQGLIKFLDNEKEAIFKG